MQSHGLFVTLPPSGLWWFKTSPQLDPPSSVAYLSIAAYNLRARLLLPLS